MGFSLVVLLQVRGISGVEGSSGQSHGKSDVSKEPDLIRRRLDMNSSFTSTLVHKVVPKTFTVYTNLNVRRED